MIARNPQSRTDPMDIWSKLSAPTPAAEIQWRQDGKPIARGNKHFARFVAYVDAQFVRDRLDAVVPGEWDLHLEALPNGADPDGCAVVVFKAKLQILGVVREDVGYATDYKAAASDAFKRVAMRYGIGHDLYRFENNWVEVDGDGKYAKPLVQPGDAYERRYGAIGVPNRNGAHPENGNGAAPRTAVASSAQPAAEPRSPAPQSAPATPAPNEPRASDEPQCPACGGRMWDNRLSKRNPTAPDFKCRNRSCEGAFWPGQWPPSPPATDDQLLQIHQLAKNAAIHTRTLKSVEGKLAAHMAKAKIITQHQAENVILELKNRIAAAAAKPQQPLQLAGTAAGADADNSIARTLADPDDDGLPF